LPQVNNWNAWTTVHGGIYFLPAGLPDSLRYYDFASGQIRDVLKFQKDFSDGLSISPDGRYLLYSQLDDLAQSFDPERGQLTGDSHVVATKKWRHSLPLVSRVGIQR